MDAFVHESVMPREVVSFLSPRNGGVYADATLGGAGHTALVLDACAPDGTVIALDRDPDAIMHAEARLSRYGQRVRIVHAAFSSLGEVLAAEGHAQVDGVLADLGVSSPQLDTAERGFSFSHDGPLDMRMDTSRGETAKELIARSSESELADLIYRFGEERRSRAIARSVRRALAEDQLETTDDLRRAVVRAIGRPPGSKTDPATRTFQALRIAVNQEVHELESLLAQLADVLVDDGVAVIISFHSLEDRLVKHAFRNDARFLPLTKRPLVASDEEQAQNRRSRSAKLRAAKRVPRAQEGEAVA